MRYLSIVVISLVLAAAAAADPQPAPAPQPMSAPVYVLTGGGYGHGVGLSQYGALAQAKAGRTYRQILDFYYQGTAAGTSPVSKVRVLLATGKSSLVIDSPVPFVVRDGGGVTTGFPAGPLPLGPDLELAGDGTPVPLTGPLVFLPGKGGTLSVDGRGYRGELHVSVVDGALQVIDVVGLDAYLLGVVPGEVSSEWPAEALKAQAVAARSYALANLVKNRPFDLYADQRSQVYNGVAAETPPTSAAVRATGREIRTFDGKAASTLYYSSSGGRTASSLDVFGVPYRYLQTRVDPWDGLSPFHRWVPKTYTPAMLERAFGLTSPVVDVQVVPTESGRPASVTLVTKSGLTVPLRAADVRARLGLRSTAFRLGVLRIGRVAGPVLAGKPVTLTGVAKDVEGAVLQKLGVTGNWVPSARVAPGVDGSFAIMVRPKVTATYRLSAGGLPGPALTVTVSAGTRS